MGSRKSFHALSIRLARSYPAPSAFFQNRSFLFFTSAKWCGLQQVRVCDSQIKPASSSTNSDRPTTGSTLRATTGRFFLVLFTCSPFLLGWRDGQPWGCRCSSSFCVGHKRQNPLRDSFPAYLDVLRVDFNPDVLPPVFLRHLERCARSGERVKHHVALVAPRQDVV